MYDKTGNISTDYRDDAYVDCLNATDEPQLVGIGRNKGNNNMWSLVPSQVSTMRTGIICVPNQLRTTPWQKLCILERDVHGNIMHCRRGTHLMRCSKVPCGSMYKCPNYYCLDWKLVCDGVWDCPKGTDEEYCLTRDCGGMFSCPNTSMCILARSLCDSFNDCPLYHDEIFTC